jgi:hypothetical protein
VRKNWQPPDFERIFRQVLKNANHLTLSQLMICIFEHLAKKTPKAVR